MSDLQLCSPVMPSGEDFHTEGSFCTCSLQEHFLENHGFWWSGERRYANAPSCGFVSTFFFDVNGISFENILTGIMKLPQSIRDQIYELAVTVDISENSSSTYWLDANGWLSCPLFRSKDRKSEPVPTLERKGRYWKDWARTPFCHFQGFVKGLENRKANGSLSAGLVLEDFLGFAGDHVVVETGNLSCSDRHFCFHLPGKEHDPILWLKSLQRYLPYFKHIAVGLPAGDPSYYDCGLRGNRNYGPECVKLCKYIHESFTNLKSVIFWIQISERELKRTLRNPEKQEWIQAFNSFSAYKIEVEVSVIDPDEAKVLWCTCTFHNRSRVWWPTGSWEQKWWREKEILKRLLRSGFHSLTDDLEDQMGLETLFKNEEKAGN